MTILIFRWQPQLSRYGWMLLLIAQQLNVITTRSDHGLMRKMMSEVHPHWMRIFVCKNVPWGLYFISFSYCWWSQRHIWRNISCLRSFWGLLSGEFVEEWRWSKKEAERDPYQCSLAKTSHFSFLFSQWSPLWCWNRHWVYTFRCQKKKFTLSTLCSTAVSHRK